MSDPIDLTLKRLERLEERIGRMHEEMGRGFDQLGRRFEQLESAMGKIVNVLEAHDERLEQLVARIDRLSDQVIRSRTQDLDRMADLDRRLRLLEDRQQT